MIIHLQELESMFTQSSPVGMPQFYQHLLLAAQQGLPVQHLLIKLEALNLMRGQMVTGLPATLTTKSLFPTLPKTLPSSLFLTTHPGPISLHQRMLQVVDMPWMGTIIGPLHPPQCR